MNFRMTQQVLAVCLAAACTALQALDAAQMAELGRRSDKHQAVAAPKGPQARQHWLRVTAAGGMVTSEAPITVALKGGWRSQSGEQVAMLKGEFGDAGQLTVRWRFNVK